MNYETLMKTLLTNITESLPMCAESYEHVARQFDTEFHAYFDDRHVPSITGGSDGEVESPHKLFHKPCYESVMRVVQKVRKTVNEPVHPVEGVQVVAHVESHCIQLAHPEQHQLTPVQAATNRAIWQGANALLAMAFCLTKDSQDWMHPANTWRKGVAAVITCIAVLRIRRNHPDELKFNNPDDAGHPLEFAERMMSHQEETGRIISDLFAYRPEVAVPA